MKPDSFHLAAGDGDEDFRQGRASSDAAPSADGSGKRCACHGTGYLLDRPCRFCEVKDAPSAHTPGPWLLELPAAGDWSSRTAAIRAGRWGVIARIGLDPNLPHWDGPQRANAARIVQCVNAHDELVSLLRKFVDCDFTYFKGKVLGSNAGLTRDDVMRARAAIAKATSNTDSASGSPASQGQSQVNKETP